MPARDNDAMKIAVPTPLRQLVADPFAGRSVPDVAEHGPLAALAQGEDWRSKIERLESAIESDLPALDLPVTHRFSRGVYARELFIPKGTVLTGRIHKYSQINVLVMGDISVLTEQGIQRVRPPFVVESPPGTKRVAYAHEDTIWLTICGTDTTDTELLEDELTTRTYAEYDAFCAGLLEGSTTCLLQP